MAESLKGKIALITGAGSGIGRATAKLFASEGAAVLVADFNEKGGQQTVAMVSEAGGEAAFFQVDVSDSQSTQNMFKAVGERYGGIDILMNNAGIGENVNAKIDEMPEEVFDKVVAVNLRGVFLGIKYGVPQLRARGGGRIINTASIAGMGGLPRSCAYAASKAGVINLTKTAALEYARHNIRVNCICPGYADTAILDTGRDDTSHQQVREMLSKRLPVRRLGQAEEVAQTALYLAAGPDFVTGTSLVIDGGIRAM